VKKQNSTNHTARPASIGYMILLLATAACIPYLQVVNHAFISYDDDEYITKNLAVQNGLKLPAVAKAFSSGYAANWHPLTWISHMIDCQLFGLHAGAHHMVSVLFHVLNTILLLLILRAMTGALWKSAFVAALFALHPMHVESVAWASERKDVLSAFFWMATTGSYLWYVKNKGRRRYLLVVLCYGLGLMAKPMLVTLPIVLLLLDVWPLRRVDFKKQSSFPTISSVKSLLIEKIPLFLLSLASCIVTLAIQKTAGAVATPAAYPIGERITNAVVSYGIYIWKLFVPTNMAIFYPRVLHVDWAAVIFSLLFCACVTILSFKLIRSRPYILTGWLWFVITMVPVIGLVQVGSQAMADRYTYLPYIGLFMSVTWGAWEWMGATRFGRRTLAIAGIVTLLALGIITRNQVGYWKDSTTVFTHALKVTKDNYIALANLGIVSEDQGRVDQAVDYYEKALTINSNLLDVNNNLANIFASRGQRDWAIQCYERAIKINPKHYKVHFNLGNALKDQGRPKEAAVEYEKALKLNADDENVYFNLGIVLEASGMLDEAIGHYEKALALRPEYPDVHNNLGIVLAKKGSLDEAIKQFQEALRIKPDFAMAKANLDQAVSIRAAGKK
jgi:tetratricopeptide (TPR) repeat protein